MSAILATWPKQPGETRDYDISFAEYLSLRSDTIASHTVVADPGINVDDSSALSGVVKVWLSGGTSGTTYKVTATVTTTGGRVVEAEVKIKVKEV